MIKKMICEWLECNNELIDQLALLENKAHYLEQDLKVKENEALQKTKALFELSKENSINVELLEEVLQESEEKDLLLHELKQELDVKREYQGRHSEARITYKRPFFYKKDTIREFGIDVRQFITPNNFEIFDDLARKDLFYSADKNLDELIPKIYYEAKKNYKYEYDQEYGFSEFWMFPFELLQMRKLGRAGDCEEWANLIGSYFACAGVPRSRWWVSAGNVRAGGFGHATIYCQANDGEWHHLNSTSFVKNRKSIKDFPHKDDENDGIGIKPKGFWFSFNDYYSISDFESTEARQSFQKECKNIKITKKR
jgi:predicted transglutaminase-like cysteine proteinase